MKHYLKKLEDTIRSNWEQKALCDYGGEQFTYGDIATQIEQFRLFLDEAGISKGEKIALFGRNSARWAMTFWGVNANGRVAVPLLADFHPDSIQALVNHSDSVLLFTDEDIWSRLRPESMPLLKAAIDIRSGRLLWYADETAAEAWENREAAFRLRFPEGMRLEQISIPEHDMGEVAIINYTSGTTGNPKGVMLTYGALSDTDDFSNSHFPNHPGETIVSMLPLAHMYGLVIEFIHPNIDGVTVYFLGKTPSPTTLLKAMQQVRPYMVVTVPLVMEKVYASSIRPALGKMKVLLSIPGLNKLIYRTVRKKVEAAFGGRVRCFIMGGAPLKPEVERCFRKMRLPYMVGYGMTEACPLLGWEWWKEFVPGSCGKAVHEIRIDSSDPERIPGEIQSRGPNITLGYYKNPAADEAAHTEDGWFRTGDLGVMDEAGNIFIRGRIKALILNSSGQNIYPEEVEQVLSNDPIVEESVVLSRDGKIVALVYPHADAVVGTNEEQQNQMAAEIRSRANGQLPKFSQIFYVELVDLPFERTAKGSIKRHLYK